jgi:hypothetical protein
MRPVLLLTLVLSGCALHAQPLAQLQLRPSERLAVGLRTQLRIAVFPFEDARGGEFARVSPNSYIPIVNWFHQSREAFYPENAGILRTRTGERGAVSTGAVASAMPSLLADMMRSMALTDAASVADRPEAAAQGFEYLVTGKVVRTHFREDESAVLQIALSLVGVPYRFVHYDLEYEVTLADARAPWTPIFQRRYACDERRAIGLYYNREWAYPMFVAALEKTMPAVVNDIASILAARS